MRQVMMGSQRHADTMLPAKRRVRVDEHMVSYRVRDDLAPRGRIPVVLLHGQIVSGAYVEPFMRHLAPHHAVFAPDLPGYGRSSKPDRVLSADELGAVVVEWARAVGLERYVLVGASFGCGVAAAATLLDQEATAGLVLQGPTMEPEGRGHLRSLVRGIRDMHREPAGAGLEQLFLRDYLRAGTRRSLATWRMAITDRIEERLPAVTVPTLIVHSADDALISDGWVRHLVHLLPDGRLRVVPGAAHCLVYTAPERLLDEVLPFLAKHVEDRAPPTDAR